MALPVPADRWSHEHDACSRCGTTDTPHHAHGLCRSCAPREAYMSYGWPKGQRTCTACGCSWSEVGYRSRGLCNGCWDQASAANELAMHARKGKHVGLDWGQVLARRLAELVGATQAAADCGVGGQRFRDMATGKAQVTKAMARRIAAKLKGYDR